MFNCFFIDFFIIFLHDQPEFKCLIVLTAIVYNCNNVNSDNDHYDENIK